MIEFFNLLLLFVALDARYSLYYSDDHEEPSGFFDCLYANMDEQLVDNTVSYVQKF